MWSYRYIFATILTFFCVEVGLWIFCKLGEPTIHVAKTQISPTGNRKNRFTEDEIRNIFQTEGAHQQAGSKENQSSVFKVLEILKKQGGFFLDIGTRDGLIPSDPLWFEKQHDWTGLLIELDPYRCKPMTKLKRKARRLCGCLSNSQGNVSFQTVGGDNQVINHTLERDNKSIVPCTDVSQALHASGVSRIDLCFLNVQRAGSVILDLMRSLLRNGTFKVDIWSLKYGVTDGIKAVVGRSINEFNALRKLISGLGGYFEYSQVSANGNSKDLYDSDVVFVSENEWCRVQNKFPNGTRCQGKEKYYRINEYLLSPHPYRNVKDTDRRYSQARQDEIVFDIVQKSGGFFIDMGANNGQFLSNSLWLERHHNWTGLLIEADPELCQRIDKLKRHAWRLCGCICKENKAVTFIKDLNHKKNGAVKSQTNKHHMELLNRTNAITVPCFNLENVLSVIKTHHIDFYSLDVEGGEMTVLESLRDGLKTRRITVDV